MLDLQQRVGGRGADRGASRVRPELRDDKVAAGIGVVDEEVSVRLEVRMKGESEEPALAAAAEPAGNAPQIEEEAGLQPLVLDHAHGPALFDDEEAIRVVVGVDDAERVRQPAQDVPQCTWPAASPALAAGSAVAAPPAERGLGRPADQGRRWRRGAKPGSVGVGAMDAGLSDRVGPLCFVTRSGGVGNSRARSPDLRVARELGVHLAQNDCRCLPVVPIDHGRPAARPHR